jgi:uncharacterized protein (TIGR00251 family)
MRKPKFSDARRGAAITVKVTPRAKKTAVAGVMDDGTIKIKVAAPPVDGAANEVLIKFLAETLGLPKSQVDIVAGETSERKLISLVGISPEKVDQILRGLAAAAGPEDEHYTNGA